MAGWTDGVARALFYNVGAYHDGFLNRPRQPYPVDYSSPEQRQTLDGYYNLGVTDRQTSAGDRFAGQTGLGDPGANVPAGNNTPGQPPLYVPPGPQAQAPQYWYDQGYNDSGKGAPPRADLGYADPKTAPTGTPAYFYWLGYQDRTAGRPRQDVSLLGTGGGAPGLDPNIGYELYATVLGRGVSVDLALGAQALFRPAVRWDLLGGYQGDARRGFRLSGPGGAVLRVGRASGQPPQAFGLPAYVGVFDRGRGRSQVRLLDLRWLENNIGPDWWALT